MFSLDASLSIRAGGKKTLVVGKWPISDFESYNEKGEFRP
ncbi:unnamed protein product, partial [marine sediment metagenome]